MKLTNIHKIYFLGIGGIGMSALVRYFLHRKVQVFGYDKTPTPLTALLELEGANITFDDQVDTLQTDVDLVIYTPAIPKTNQQLTYYLTNQYEVLKRSEVLSIITQSAFTIAIAGSHGKTSTSCMVAHLLQSNGGGCTAFLGGISVNLNSNFACTNTEVIVVEADEYDRSFHRLHPDIAIITSTDADHLDIYETAENVVDAYIQFAKNIKPTGVLIAHERTQLNAQIINAENQTYSADNAFADIQTNIKKVNWRQYIFDYTNHKSNRTIENITLNVPGIHNIENMTAAIEVALRMGLSDEQVREGVSSFKGIKRRFEYVVDTDNVVFIDDYAHHPSEITNFLKSLRLQYQNKKIAVIFQPHLFSRTRDFLDGFASSLSIADSVVLLPIYPARELPIEGVCSNLIFEKLTCESKYLIEKDALLSTINKLDFDVIATVGAGDIDAWVNPIKENLLTNSKIKLV